MSTQEETFDFSFDPDYANPRQFDFKGVKVVLISEFTDKQREQNGRTTVMHELNQEITLKGDYALANSVARQLQGGNEAEGYYENLDEDDYDEEDGESAEDGEGLLNGNAAAGGGDDDDDEFTVANDSNAGDGEPEYYQENDFANVAEDDADALVEDSLEQYPEDFYEGDLSDLLTGKDDLVLDSKDFQEEVIARREEKAASRLGPLKTFMKKMGLATTFIDGGVVREDPFNLDGDATLYSTSVSGGKIGRNGRVSDSTSINANGSTTSNIRRYDDTLREHLLQEQKKRKDKKKLSPGNSRQQQTSVSNSSRGVKFADYDKDDVPTFAPFLESLEYQSLKAEFNQNLRNVRQELIEAQSTSGKNNIVVIDSLKRKEQRLRQGFLRKVEKLQKWKTGYEESVDHEYHNRLEKQKSINGWSGGEGDDDIEDETLREESGLEVRKRILDCRMNTGFMNEGVNHSSLQHPRLCNNKYMKLDRRFLTPIASRNVIEKINDADVNRVWIVIIRFDPSRKIMSPFEPDEEADIIIEDTLYPDQIPNQEWRVVMKQGVRELMPNELRHLKESEKPVRMFSSAVDQQRRYSSLPTVNKETRTPIPAERKIVYTPTPLALSFAAYLKSRLVVRGLNRHTSARINVNNEIRKDSPLITRIVPSEDNIPIQMCDARSGRVAVLSVRLWYGLLKEDPAQLNEILRTIGEFIAQHHSVYGEKKDQKNIKKTKNEKRKLRRQHTKK